MTLYCKFRVYKERGTRKEWQEKRMEMTRWWVAIVADRDDIQMKLGYWVGAVAVRLGSAPAGGLLPDPAPNLVFGLFPPFLILFGFFGVRVPASPFSSRSMSST